MSHRFFQNKECEYYPCHCDVDSNSFSCLFCYCPLYTKECIGFPKFLSNGIKDCSDCSFSHDKNNYDEILTFLIH